MTPVADLLRQRLPTRQDPAQPRDKPRKMPTPTLTVNSCHDTLVGSDPAELEQTQHPRSLLLGRLGIQGTRKDRVSHVCRDLDEHVEQFRTRPLEGA